MDDQGRLGAMTTASRVRLRLAGDERLVASVRRGDAAAFEAMYDRHSAELLSFCVYMLGSRHDAEDAVQATFASAYRALHADRRAVNLRAWLFTIARNDCLNILRRRRTWVELDGEPAADGDPLRELELREEVRQMIAGLRELPESQRASLVLAELHGFSQAEIGSVLGVRAEQVKAFICQARSNLISERSARETDCCEIREELSDARGAALLRGRLRRHLRSCDDCRTYADGVARQRRTLGAVLPLAPSLLLKYWALEEALGSGAVADPGAYVGGAAVGGSVAGAAAEVAGGGFKALILKLATGVAFLGAGAGAGASMLASQGASAPLLASAAGSRGGGVTLAASSVGGRSAGSRHGRSGARRQLLSTTGAVIVGLERVSPGHGGTTLAPAGAPTGEAERNARREARERQGEEQQRRAEEEHRREREQRPPGPTVENLAEHQLARAQRIATTPPRQVKSELEHQQAREERRHERASRPPKSTKEERQHEREEHRPERVARPPKSEAERARAHEERLRRREQERAEAPGG